MDHSAEAAFQAFQQLGVGELAYLRVLYFDDVKLLCGADADIEPGEFAVALVDSDGSPIALRGTVADCLLAAEERGLHVAPVH
jgi:hypothetical protein